MANLKDIRRRISSVTNTQQITRAMKLVAAAKLRRAQEGILAARPYAYRIYSILLSLAKREETLHPLLEVRPEKKIRLIILAGDRGLCGSFNSSIFKAGEKFISEKRSQGIEVVIDCIGKRANDYFSKRYDVTTFHHGLLREGTYRSTSQVAREIMDAYAEGEFDAIYLVYNEFKSAIQQKVVVETLIPISTEAPPQGVLGIRESTGEQAVDYLYEPSEKAIFQEIVPKHFETQFFRAVLESIASEHGARMSAMENATKNASELIAKLTLSYNKARQAAITTELMEIVGGAEALKN